MNANVQLFKNPPRKEWDTDLRKNLGITTEKMFKIPFQDISKIKAVNFDKTSSKNRSFVDSFTKENSKQSKRRQYKQFFLSPIFHDKNSTMKRTKNKIKFSLKCKSCSIEYKSIAELNMHYYCKHKRSHNKDLTECLDSTSTFPIKDCSFCSDTNTFCPDHETDPNINNIEETRPNKIKFSLKCKSCSIEYKSIAELNMHYYCTHKRNYNKDLTECLDLTSTFPIKNCSFCSDTNTFCPDHETDPSINNIEETRLNLASTDKAIKLRLKSNSNHNHRIPYSKLHEVPFYDTIDINEDAHKCQKDEINNNQAKELDIEKGFKVFKTKNVNLESNDNTSSMTRKVPPVLQISNLPYHCSKCGLTLKSIDSEKLHQAWCLDSSFETNDCTEESSNRIQQPLLFLYHGEKETYSTNLFNCNEKKSASEEKACTIGHETEKNSIKETQINITTDENSNGKKYQPAEIALDNNEKSIQNLMQYKENIDGSDDHPQNSFFNTVANQLNAKPSRDERLLPLYECKTCGSILPNQKTFR